MIPRPTTGVKLGSGRAERTGAFRVYVESGKEDLARTSSDVDQRCKKVVGVRTTKAPSAAHSYAPMPIAMPQAGSQSHTLRPKPTP